MEASHSNSTPKDIKCILIVDDEELNRELLEGFVEALGYNYLTASDGAQALDILLASQEDASQEDTFEYSEAALFPDLVLLDAMMPGMDGFEVTERIRADQRVGQIPIIMVTALTGKEDRLRAVAAGANDFITKPIDRTELRVRMASLLRLKEAQDAVKHHNAQLARANAELWQAQETIRKERERLERILETNADAIITLDADGCIVSANAAAERISGLSRHDIIHLPYDDPCWNITALDGSPFPHELLPFAQVQRTNQVVYGVEFSMTVAEGRRIFVSVNAAPLPGEDGTISGAVISITDISERLALQGRLTHQAFHDALTGLPNRALFLNRLEQALKASERNGTGVAVLFIDLDNFKNVNDSLGHDAGDHLLIEVAERLKVCMRAADTAARLGGDEFTILIDNVAQPTDVIHVAVRILEAFHKPFLLKGREIFKTPSIGIAYSGEGANLSEDLLRNADTAMYEAKNAGRGCYRVYRDGMNKATLNILEMESALRGALERNEFVLHYQPNIDLTNNRVVGVEALVRWQHSIRGVVEPAEFIPLAEETGIILPLGQWVLREACRQTREWQEQYLPGINSDSGSLLAVSVNLFAAQLQQHDFVESVAAILSETGLPSECLVLEITETVLMEQAKSAAELLRGLKKLGVRLAIDDFGNGYSSLAYLKTFPLDDLKIDHKFVASIDKDPSDNIIVGSMISLAHALNLRVIAHGVETGSEVRQLQKMGCDLAQGYYFSESMSCKEVQIFFEQSLRK